MFKVGNETWQPKTASEHTEKIIETINQLLQQNNIKDANGNIAQLKVNYGNALYLLALGDGDRFATNDEKLSQAINSFNVELCDDQQIENLLPIAAMTRNPGSYSVLYLTVKASDRSGCVIPAGTKAPFENVNFVVQDDVVLSAGVTQTIRTVCDTLGPVAVLSGEIKDFDTQIANLESVINPQSSIPGTSPESTNELRQRLIKGDTIKYSLDGVKNALEELTGVTYARVYFNYNNSSTITLPGNVIVQPRTAYIVIHGNSPDIAKVYSDYMSAPTQNAANTAADNKKSQDKVTNSGQAIPIKYDLATEKDIYVKVVLKKDAEAGTQVDNQVKRDVIIASAKWQIGEEITSLLTSVPFANINYTDVAYTLVSENGTTWQNKIDIGCNVVPRVKDATIIIEQLE